MLKKLKDKKNQKDYNVSLVARVLEIIPLKNFETRQEMTELKVKEESPTKKEKEYYLGFSYKNSDLKTGDLCVFDIDLKEKFYDFGFRESYFIKGYKKIRYF